MSVVVDITGELSATVENGVLYSKFMSADPLQCGADNNNRAYRCAIRFPLSALPSDLDITKVELLLYETVTADASGSFKVYWGSFTDIALAAAQNLYNAADDQALYITDTSMRVIGAHTLILGATGAAQACIDLEAQKENGLYNYAVYFFVDTYETKGVTASKIFKFNGIGAAANRPILRVTYTPPPNVAEVVYPENGQTIFQALPTYIARYSHPEGEASSAFQVQRFADTATDAVPGTALAGGADVVQATSDGGLAIFTAGTFVPTPGVWYRQRWRFKSATGGLYGNWSSLATGRFRVNPGPNTPSSLTPSGGVGVGDLTPTLGFDYSHPAALAESDAMIEIRKNSDNSLIETKYTALETDDFNRGDATPPGNALTGQTWATLAGTIALVGNKLTATAVPALGNCGDSAVAKVSVIADVTLVSGAGLFGIAFLISDASNYWRFVLAESVGLWQLTKVVAGSASTVASGTLPAAVGQNPITIEARANDGQIDCYVDRYKVASVADAFNATATKHGVYWGSITPSSPSIDEFRVLRLSGVDAVTQHVAATLVDATVYKWAAKVRDYNKFSALSGYALFTPFAPPTVTITAPTELQVLASPTPTVTWTYSGGTQGKYRVIVREADNATVVYDSGYINSAATTFNIPQGYLENTQTYKITVYAQNTGGIEGSSGVRTVTTSWTVPATLSTFSATTFPQTGKITFAWSISADADFVAYEIKETQPDNTEKRVLRVTKKTQLTVDYYFAPLNRSTVYGIRQVKKFGTEEVESLPRGTTPSTTVLADKGARLHEVGDPAGTSISVAYNPQRTATRDKDFKDVQYMGRTKPVRHFGLASKRTISLRATAIFHPSSSGNDDPGEWQEKLDEWVQNGTLMCLRDTRGRKLFGYVSAYSSSESVPALADISIVFSETDFDEESIVE